MPIPVAELEADLRAAFPDAQIAIEDLAGDGDHYRARIVAPAFAGLPARAPAPARLRGAEGQDGRRAARPGPGDIGPGLTRAHARSLALGTRPQAKDLIVMTDTAEHTAVHDFIAKTIADHPVVLFMKGVPGPARLRLLGHRGADPRPPWASISWA